MAKSNLTGIALNSWFPKDLRGWKLILITSILMTGLVAFEIFNYKSTSYSFTDILGTVTLGPVQWASFLAFAFCAVDFAGLGRIFTPEQGNDEPKYVWYLFGAWVAAAAFNAILTWWGVEVAMLQKGPSLVISKYPILSNLVPVFVALIILLIRVMLINTFANLGDQQHAYRSSIRPSYRPNESTYSAPMNSSLPRAAPKPTPAASTRPLYTEPTYHPVGTNAQSPNNSQENEFPRRP